MFYKNLFFLIIFLFITDCTTKTLIKDKSDTPFFNGFSNKGFALVYSNELYKKKIISKKINERSLIIYQKDIKSNALVKITNILNNKSIIATVGKSSKYPSFNNSVLSIRIADELNLDISQPYVEIEEINGNSVYQAKKAKTFDEEKNVAVKAPVNSISINDLNQTKSDKKITSTKFSYALKIAEFYFKDTALLMSNRIKRDSSIEKPKIKKISDKKYRVYLGPFNNINSLQKSYNDISILGFENIEIIKND